VTIQLLYAGLFAVAKKKRGRQEGRNQLLPVSVIICAKNEAENLERFLPLVLEQDYPDSLYEVLVVNDGSTDATGALLSRLQQEYGHLNVLTLPADTEKDLPGKKFALAKGIEAARHERLLLTDADCGPSSPQWLKYMTGSDKDIVLGYGAYKAGPGILNKFIRWETAHTCMQYASYARRGKPYMGVGRNLSYKKSLVNALENDEGFKAVYRHTPSGDDDLLISKLVNTATVDLCLDPEAHTISEPEQTWKSWWKQKTRHISTGKYYPAAVKYSLGVYALSHGIFWLSSIILIAGALFSDPTGSFSIWHLDGCLVQPDIFTISLMVLFVFRTAIYWIIAAAWYRLLQEKKMLLFFPAGDLGWALYHVFLSPYIFWKNKRSWK